jgi:hypothetical protein
VGDAQAGEATKDRLTDDRANWVAMLDRICRPLFDALSARRLKELMPVEAYAGEQQHRRQTTNLEALGRALAGMAPWLERGATTGSEGQLRERYCEMARAAVASAVDKTSPDYMDFGGDRQTIVDTAFLSLAILRAPHELREKLPVEVRVQLADAMRATRALLGNYNNWLLFAAMIEAALFALGESWDRMRVDYAFREHANWYLGDGTYGDGPNFHQDYYNSFVILPFLTMLIDTVGAQETAWSAMAETIRERATRYAAIQERSIAPDGTDPVVGRSIAYRCGAFQLLADAALRHADRIGWAPAVAGRSVYLDRQPLPLHRGVSAIGAASRRPILDGASVPWSSVAVWSGADFKADHALEGRQRGD